MGNVRDHAVGERLLLRLKRLVTRADAADRAKPGGLLALVDDIESTRRALLRQCADIEDEMRRAAARTTAIGAYLRGSQAGRGRPQN
ncbi:MULTISPECIES: hypothetical protein [Bradyrhizobium]|jgi:hypothetical protein|nr:hypothetical protein [Bradyrhizobium diazoefficiens]MBP1066351.1 hypothetical protein [Bradyrhizobium japonicum]AND89042.1 hypothetical protein AAV28_15505 [Bradyrhizobium diazoefficiens USDA 110]AWO90647.2 hypothetical protein DI395_20575 [Bradyrhizobium diazoefficiens]QLD44566.1 hypothetical protein HUW42_27840 [Bradyrhizobium diazoefficiens]WLA59872.1 hypothetical protein QIH81_14740 [Bradyrhizobium diazoefficiens]